MNIHSIARSLLVALLALSASSALAKDISLNDLPPAVRRVADSEVKSSGSLKRVESVKQQGQNIYALTYQRPDGSNKYIYLNPDGTYVQGAPTPTPVAPAGSVTPALGLQLSQLPEAVRRTIQTETSNGPVSRIEQMPHGTTNMYEVVFRQANGKEKIIYLNPDGTYVQDAKSGSRTGRSWDVLGSGTAGGLQSLSSPTTLNFSQLPPAVQNTIRTQAGASRIQNIQSGQLNGKTIYQADIDRNGQKVQMRVDPAGTVLTPSPSSTPR